MSNFLSKIILYVSITTLIYFFLGFLADGYTDPFYLRFTSPKQKSLILGTSRVAQGVFPNVLNEELKKTKLDLPIYNYGFTILDSPFGEIYYKAIEAKLNEESTNGIFILEVNPWSISSLKKQDTPRESTREISKVSFFSINPNYDYLANAYKGSMFDLLLKKIYKDTTLVLQKDGRLEVNIDMDSLKVEKRLKSKLSTYLENSKSFTPSKERLKMLKKTLSLLNNKGKVFLVRLPIHKNILEIENNYMPKFDSIIQNEFKNVNYLNYSDKGQYYIFIDGNHLYKNSGAKFSKKLGEDINSLLYK